MAKNLLSYTLHPTPYTLHPERGFTIIEVIITIFIIGTVVSGIFGLFVLGLRSAQEGERRVVAIALGNERAEMIRNLPYLSVGTLGGIPAGSIPQTEVIARNTVEYTVRTDIRYIDDPFDGLVTSQPPDVVNTDYKQARIEVTWNSPSNPKPFLLVFIVAPAGVEGGEAAGTLDFQALAASGQGIAGVSVKLFNDAVTPTVNIVTSTDSSGRVVLPGLPESSDSYELTVTKTGYTSERTYDRTATFIPDANHAHLSMIAGQVTPKTFSLDLVSEINLTTEDEKKKKGIGAVAYAMRGTKTIGVDDQGQAVYVFEVSEQTNGAGKAKHKDLVWDSYELTIDGAATGYDIKETSLVLPVSLSPGQNVDLTAKLVPHTPISLHVTVVTPAGVPIDNATVTITLGGDTVSLGTGAVGQVFFADLAAAGDYTIAVEAPGHEPSSGTVSVAGSTRTRVELAPLP